jgi:hypothetical protein
MITYTSFPVQYMYCQFQASRELHQSELNNMNLSPRVLYAGYKIMHPLQPDVQSYSYLCSTI